MLGIWFSAAVLGTLMRSSALLGASAPLFFSVHDIHGNLDAGALGIGADHSPDLLGDAALAADDLPISSGATRSSNVSS